MATLKKFKNDHFEAFLSKVYKKGQAPYFVVNGSNLFEGRFDWTYAPYRKQFDNRQEAEEDFEKFIKPWQEE